MLSENSEKPLRYVIYRYSYYPYIVGWNDADIAFWDGFSWTHDFNHSKIFNSYIEAQRIMKNRVIDKKCDVVGIDLHTWDRYA